MSDGRWFFGRLRAWWRQLKEDQARNRAACARINQQVEALEEEIRRRRWVGYRPATERASAKPPPREP